MLYSDTSFHREPRSWPLSTRVSKNQLNAWQQAIRTYLSYQSKRRPVDQKLTGCFKETSKMAAQVNHPSFLQPHDPDVPLWRYMDLSKFADLLQRRSLAFPRADRLGDPFEGSVPVANALHIQRVIEARQNGNRTDPYEMLDDERLSNMAQQFSHTRRQMIKSCYVSCWHMNEHESLAMWKVYSASDEAVCIRTSYRTLTELLPDECYIGQVSYINYNAHQIPYNNLFAPLVHKRMSFSYEREARAIICDWDGMEQDLPDIRYVDVDLGQLVDRIFISPESPDWFLDVVKGLAETYNLTTPIERSELSASPLF